MTRLNESSMPLPSMSMSLSPSLSPSISPTPNAVVLPVLAHPSVAVNNPSPLTLSFSVTPAASKAEDVRREAAKTVAAWKSSRQAPVSAQSAAVPEESASVQFDALFDGSLPTSTELLSRGVAPAVLGQALSDSQSPSDAASRLSALGVLGSKESALAVSREDEFRFLLTRLWRKTSSAVAPAFAVDKTFRVPALKVERDGVTYFVHGVAHGKYGPPRRGAVLSTIRSAVAAGHALYSEQNLPAYYGYKAGLETLDHAAASGSPAAVVPAAPGHSRASLFLKRAVDWAVAPGSALAVLAWTLASPASVFAWVLLPLTGALAWLVLSGGLPLMAWKRRLLAEGARGEGLEDIAEQYADEARHFFTAKPDLEVLRGLELPQPLGATADPVSVRSRAIADAVAAGAAASGARSIHVVVGHLHAHEVAARLASGPTTPVPGSQIS
ncbi:MAG: hypothetical protein Q8T11_09505 [Elusimicrobiota bacterium]|nr:hypothetical protein [Elusimicrobiota bacterium]